MRLFASSLSLLVALFFWLAPQPPSAPPATATAAPGDSTREARIAYGAELYARTCSRCHNARGPAERTDREWVIIMQHMQTRANLTREQANVVRDFLLASNDAEQAPGRLREDLPAVTANEITEAVIAEGRMVYAGAGTCFACHGQALEGTPVAPNLNDDDWAVGTGTYPALLEVIRNGVAGTAMAAYPGGISDEQARVVAAYVWAVSQGRAEP